MQVHDRLAYLIQQVVSNMATADELQELSDMVKEDQEGIISQQIESLLKQQEDSTYDYAYWDNIAGNILSADHNTPVKSVSYRWTAIAAAIALLVISGAAYFLLRVRQPLPPAAIVQTQPVISPGGNRAMLTLADGTQIPLDSAQNGTLAQQGNALIIKSDSGRLTYTHQTATSAAVVHYNTLRTPAGGQYQLELPDGTRVWLNAAS